MKKGREEGAALREVFSAHAWLLLADFIVAVVLLWWLLWWWLLLFIQLKSC